MKVCYFITTLGHGRGGHFQSLKATVQSLRERLQCVIVNAGRTNSPIVDSTEAPVYNVRWNGINVPSALRRACHIARNENPDVLHAFDSLSYFLARLIGKAMRLPVVLTKCGGPNPRCYFPYAKQLIVYSAENEAYFERARKFASSCLYRIPNRATELTDDTEGIRKIRRMLRGEAKVFLRINRFVEYYRTSIFQSVHLIKRLNAEGRSCQLVLIGVPEDKRVFVEICGMRKRDIVILADDEYTVAAAQLVSVADFVIGTGRGVMEAASKGKVLLTPIKGGRYPLLITEDNLAAVMATNFSPRNVLAGFDEEANYQAIASLLTDDASLARQGRWSREIFDRLFSMERVTDTYCDLYRKAEYDRKVSALDVLLNFCVCLRGFWRTGKQRWR